MDFFFSLFLLSRLICVGPCSLRCSSACDNHKHFISSASKTDRRLISTRTLNCDSNLANDEKSRSHRQSNGSRRCARSSVGVSHGNARITRSSENQWRTAHTEEDFHTRRSHVIIETIVVGRASDNLLSSNSQSGRLLTLSFLRRSASSRSLS